MCSSLCAAAMKRSKACSFPSCISQRRSRWRSPALASLRRASSASFRRSSVTNAWSADSSSVEARARAAPAYPRASASTACSSRTSVPAAASAAHSAMACASRRSSASNARGSWSMRAAAAEAASWRTALPWSPRDHFVCASRIAAKASLCPRTARIRGDFPVTFAVATHSRASGASAFINSAKSGNSATRPNSRAPTERIQRPSEKRAATSPRDSSRAASRNLRSGSRRRASSSAKRRSKGCGGRGCVLSPSRPAASFSAALCARVSSSSLSFRSRQCHAWTPTGAAAARMHKTMKSAKRFMSASSRDAITVTQAVRSPKLPAHCEALRPRLWARRVARSVDNSVPRARCASVLLHGYRALSGPSFSRVSVAIQFVSQVLPPSSENACSKWQESGVTSEMTNRTRMARPLSGS